jgi:hypothetical protein
MKKEIKEKLVTIFIAAVWLLNGLFCKVLNFVPRHQQIVSRILGDKFSRFVTILIGFSEIIMAIWVVTRFKSKMNAIIQIIIVATMNVIEFIMASDLLLWGKMNAFFALLFIGMIYYNEFILRKRLNQITSK